MLERLKSKTVSILDKSRAFAERPPDDAAGFIKWFQDKVDSIPAEYRASATIELAAESEWDSYHVEIYINYERPETDEEYEARCKEHHRISAGQEAVERRKYEELKRKFGP